MKLRFPLYSKILVWFLLNVIVIGLAVFVLMRVQFRLGLDSLLAGRAGERIQSLSDVITAELGERPREEWTGILKRFGEAYRVQFGVFRAEGTQIAGEPLILPRPVLARISEPRTPIGPRDGGPGPERRRQGRGGSPALGAEFPDMQRNPPAGPPVPRMALPGSRGRFIMRTEEPLRYWIGVRVPVRDGPHILLMVSETLGAGGLLFDISLWVWLGVAALVFSILFWLPLVRSMTRSIGQMTHATQQIAQGQFETRVDERRRDELGQLGGGINSMASRLAGFVNGQKRFLGDIAHELCSPIARLQMALGILEQRGDAKQKPYLEDVREEVQQISGLVNELLSFSKASLGSTTIRLQLTNVRATVEKAVRREALNEAAVVLEIDEPLCVMADPELLLRAISNLLRNATRYAGHAGPITVAAAHQHRDVIIRVQDRGPGIPDEALPNIFDPFYRVDPSRDRETGGVGLGLSIVKTCVEACNGTVLARNRAPSGLEVEIRLNAAEGSAHGTPPTASV